jgi:hypothetical protein
MIMDQDNRQISFQEHNKSIKEFQRSHIGPVLFNAPRYGVSPTLAKTRTVQPEDVMVYTGGSKLDGLSDWPSFALLPKVAQYKISTS